MKLKVNDVITKEGESRKVLEVFTNTVVLNYRNNPTKADDCLYTEQELLDEGWKFPEVKWQPEDGERYWYVTEYGSVSPSYFVDDEESISQDKLLIGNCYSTKELAEEALKRVLLAYKG